MVPNRRLIVSICFSLVLLISGLVTNTAAAGKLVFSEDFGKAKPGDSVSTVKGWETAVKNGASFIVAEDHSVTITHSTWNGISYSNDRMTYKLGRKLEKGSLEFELKMDAHIMSWSLQIYVGNQMSAFDRNSWRFLLSGDGKWHDLKPLEFDKWHPIKIEFDATADPPFLMFHADGQEILKIPRDNFAGMDAIIFGDYGACKEKIVNHIRNIKVSSEE